MRSRPKHHPWHHVADVSIDTGLLLLADLTIAEQLAEEILSSGELGNVVVGAGGAAVSTGIGDGTYAIEVRYANVGFARRVAEVRVRFLEREANLGIPRRGSRAFRLGRCEPPRNHADLGVSDRVRTAGDRWESLAPGPETDGGAGGDQTNAKKSIDGVRSGLRQSRPGGAQQQVYIHAAAQWAGERLRAYRIEPSPDPWGTLYCLQKLERNRSPRAHGR
jgi:hypothetical protein